MKQKRARDLIFPVYGDALPMEHRWELSVGIRRVCPFWCPTTCCGIFPVRGKGVAQGLIRLSEPGELRIRVRHTDEYLFRCLAGEVLRVENHLIRLGPLVSSDLEPSHALRADVVHYQGVNSREDVIAGARQELRMLGVQGELRAGASVQVRTWKGAVTGYELGVLGLNKRDSVTLQSRGLGGLRMLGFGVFQEWSGRGLQRV